MSGFDDDDLTRPLEGARRGVDLRGADEPGGRPRRVGGASRRASRRLAAGRSGTLEERLRGVPWWAWLTLFVAVFALVPVGVTDGYGRRVAFDTVLFMMLALGLNVVVGWGGLLDLGYVMFYGFGALHVREPAARTSSTSTGRRSLVIAIAIVGGALLGILVGLPSRRLSGDYLAIVTLFAYQIFLSVTDRTATTSSAPT